MLAWILTDSITQLWLVLVFLFRSLPGSSGKPFEDHRPSVSYTSQWTAQIREINLLHNFPNHFRIYWPSIIGLTIVGIFVKRFPSIWSTYNRPGNKWQHLTGYRMDTWLIVQRVHTFIIKWPSAAPWTGRLRPVFGFSFGPVVYWKMRRCLWKGQWSSHMTKEQWIRSTGNNNALST